jgi:hypothetical protein
MGYGVIGYDISNVVTISSVILSIVIIVSLIASFSWLFDEIEKSTACQDGDHSSVWRKMAEIYRKKLCNRIFLGATLSVLTIDGLLISVQFTDAWRNWNTQNRDKKINNFADSLAKQVALSACPAGQSDCRLDIAISWLIDNHNDIDGYAKHVYKKLSQYVTDYSLGDISIPGNVIEDAAPPFSNTTIVFSYKIMRGSTYNVCSISCYNTVSFGIEASWEVFKPRDQTPSFTGKIGRQDPPDWPTWSGKKFPYEVFIDDVTERIIKIYHKQLYENSGENPDKKS